MNQWEQSSINDGCFLFAKNPPKEYNKLVMSRKKKGLSFYNKEKKINKKSLGVIAKFVFWGAVMILIAFVFVYCFGIKTSVIGDSMEPTLYNAQEIFIDRFSYFLSSPGRGDVIVFSPNGNKNAHYYVKRVIAVPGDTILIKDGYVYVNGELSEDVLSKEKVKAAGIAKSGITLLDDEYFVLGDNVNHSEDSRDSNIGIVKSEYIIGKAWYHLKSQYDKAGFIK